MFFCYLSWNYFHFIHFVYFLCFSIRLVRLLLIKKGDWWLMGLRIGKKPIDYIFFCAIVLHAHQLLKILVLGENFELKICSSQRKDLTFKTHDGANIFCPKGAFLLKTLAKVSENKAILCHRILNFIFNLKWIKKKSLDLRWTLAASKILSPIIPP